MKHFITIFVVMVIVGLASFSNAVAVDSTYDVRINKAKAKVTLARIYVADVLMMGQDRDVNFFTRLTRVEHDARIADLLVYDIETIQRRDQAVKADYLKRLNTAKFDAEIAHMLVYDIKTIKRVTAAEFATKYQNRLKRAFYNLYIAKMLVYDIETIQRRQV